VFTREPENVTIRSCRGVARLGRWLGTVVGESASLFAVSSEGGGTMKRWRRTFGAVLAVSVVAMACTGGDGGGGDTDAIGTQQQVTLDFWVFEEAQDEFFDTVVVAFEEENPNINLEVTAYPEGNYGTKVDTAIAAGNPPDLGLSSGVDTMRSGVLLPLDDIVQKYNIDLSTFSPSIVGTAEQQNAEYGCAYQGTLYCLGSYTGSVQLFYNKAMLDAAGIPHPVPWPPITIDQFVDTACQLTDSAKGVFGAAYGDPVGWMPWEVLVSPDGRTATGHVNGPASVHAHDVLGRGIREGCAPSLTNFDPWEQGTDFFAAGKLAMVVTDFAGLKKIERQGIDYGVTAPPTPEGFEPWFNVWTDSVAVYKGTEHPEEAKAFIAFLATQGQSLRVQLTGDLPLDFAVAKEANWAKDVPGRQDVLEILPHARPKPFFPGTFWLVFGPLYDAFALTVSGEKPAQAALDEAAPAIQENLDKAWEKWERPG
jgi:ABC-type glycerol-3-phosphate transport system substrate-binding protein